MYLYLERHVDLDQRPQSRLWWESCLKNGVITLSTATPYSCLGWVLGESISCCPQTLTHGLVDLRAWVDNTFTWAWFSACCIELATILCCVADKWQWLGPALNLGCNAAHPLSC